MAKGTAGIKAEPNCNLQAISPTSLTTTFATKPKKIPKAVEMDENQLICSHVIRKLR